MKFRFCPIENPKMIVFCFSGSSTYHKLVGVTCSFMFMNDHDVRIREESQIFDYVENPNKDYYTTVVSMIRVPEMDADLHIKNCYAYTQVVMTSLEPKNLKEARMYLRNNIDILRWLEKRDIRLSFAAKLEQMMWKSIPVDLQSHMTCVLQRFLSQWVAEAAEKYMAPDYIWKSPGKRFGRRTIDIMKEQFDSHLMV